MEYKKKKKRKSFAFVRNNKKTTIKKKKIKWNNNVKALFCNLTNILNCSFILIHKSQKNNQHNQQLQNYTYKPT